MTKNACYVLLVLCGPLLLVGILFVLLPSGSVSHGPNRLPKQLEMDNPAAYERFESLVDNGAFVEGVSLLGDSVTWKPPDGDYQELELPHYDGRAVLTFPASWAPCELRCEIDSGIPSGTKRGIRVHVEVFATSEEAAEFFADRTKKSGLTVFCGENDTDGQATARIYANVIGKQVLNHQERQVLAIGTTLAYKGKWGGGTSSGEHVPRDGIVCFMIEGQNTPLRIANPRIRRLPPMEPVEIKQTPFLTPDEQTEGWLEGSGGWGLSLCGNNDTESLLTLPNHVVRFDYQGTIEDQRFPAATLEFRQGNTTHSFALKPTPTFLPVEIDKNEERLLVTIDGKKAYEVLFSDPAYASWKKAALEAQIRGSGFCNIRNLRVLPRHMTPIHSERQDEEGIVTISPEMPCDFPAALSANQPFLLTWETFYDANQAKLEVKSGGRFKTLEVPLPSSRQGTWIPMALYWTPDQQNADYASSRHWVNRRPVNLSYQATTPSDESLHFQATDGNIRLRNIRIATTASP